MHLARLTLNSENTQITIYGEECGGPSGEWGEGGAAARTKRGKSRFGRYVPPENPYTRCFSQSKCDELLFYRS